MSSLCYHPPQVHVHRDLHFRVTDKDPGQGLLRGEVHLPEGPVELAGFQCHPHGVSVLTCRVKLSETQSCAHSDAFEANQSCGVLGLGGCEKTGAGGSNGDREEYLQHSCVHLESMTVNSQILWM